MTSEEEELGLLNQVRDQGGLPSSQHAATLSLAHATSRYNARLTLFARTGSLAYTPELHRWDELSMPESARPVDRQIHVGDSKLCRSRHEGSQGWMSEPQRLVKARHCLDCAG